ncbi:MAG: type II CAAX endopeptidase family protein [Caldilineaceae bacterium]
MTTETQLPQVGRAMKRRLSARNWLQRRPLLTYALLAYGITWSILLGTVFAVESGLLAPDTPVLGLAADAAVYGPAAAALLVLAATQGRAGVLPWLRSIVRWRVSVRWYLFTLVGVPLLALVGSSFLYGALPFQSLVQQWPALFTRFVPLILLTALTTGLGEEPGWRGFALPNLQRRHGPLLGTLLLGLLWAFWHLPNLVLQPTGAATFGLWFLATMVNAFVLTWVYNCTGGSVLLVILLHATQNSTSRLVANLVGATDPVQFQNDYSLITVLTFGLLMAIVIAATHGRLGYRAAALLPGENQVETRSRS